jgi:hypothetical protein
MSGSERAWTRRRRLLIAALLVAAAAATAWLVAGRSGDDSESASKAAADLAIRSRTATPPATRRTATPPAQDKRRARQAHPRYNLLPRIEPAKIVPDPDPVVSADVLDPIVNAWRAGDHRGITLVEAGLAGDDPSRTKGRFVVFRERERPFAQGLDIVDVRGAGALRITRAPTGRRAAHWARRRGDIEFVGERGITGTLHLQTDTVTRDSR